MIKLELIRLRQAQATQDTKTSKVEQIYLSMELLQHIFIAR